MRRYPAWPPSVADPQFRPDQTISRQNSPTGPWSPGAGVLASAGVVLCSREGALELSYCRGVSDWANATPDVMISAELAEITNSFRNPISFRNAISSGVGFGGKRGASRSGSTIAVAALSRAYAMQYSSDSMVVLHPAVNTRRLGSCAE